MNREEVKKLLPILQAFADGRAVQFMGKGSDEWNDTCKDDLSLTERYDYRIKPEPTYRPFKDAEECWQEMLKHQPFGWVIKLCDYKVLIAEVYKGVTLCNQIGSCYDFEEAKRIFTFADGSVFGVKEMED